MSDKEFMCIAGSSPNGEKVPCIFPDCKREMCFVYQMKILEVPVYDNREDNKE